MRSASAAIKYFEQTDLLATSPGEWLGKGAEMLGLNGSNNQMHFHSLAYNLHPQTGEQLTTYTRDNRRVGLDMTFNAMKSVSLARELAGPNNEGDPRIEEAHREAVKYAMTMIEKDMQGRVRKGGAFSNRTTGNMVAYRVTHRDTRINADDQMPDPSLHDHVFVFNATFDPVEKQWKAAEIGQIKHDAPFYEAVYANRMATNLKQLGYGIEKRGKSFEITGISQELRDKFSRRSAYINMVATKLGITNPQSKAKLGATTRLGKTKELADDLQAYYASRLTPAESFQLGALEGNPSHETSVEAAVSYAIGHMFERQSVVDEKRLYETALRHGIGSVTPEGVQKEAKRQGLLVRNGEATTKGVLAEEARVIAFARDGKGTCRPMGAEVSLIRYAGSGDQGLGASPPDGAKIQPNLATAPALDQQQKGRPDESKRPTPAQQDFTPDTATLSSEQQAICRHIWNSTDRVILIEGDAGTGKTQTMQRTVPGIDKPGVFLAPSASASRDTLRSKGFTNANTITQFLNDKQFREQARNGYIYIDEAPLAGISDIEKVFGHARELNARVILQGDRKQHKSIARGNVFDILDKFAGLPIARLQTNWRQERKEYKAAVDAIAGGRIVEGYDALEHLGWVKATPELAHNTPLVDEYMEAIDTKRANQDISDRVLAIAPTHAEAAEVTDAIRLRLQERGIVAKEEHEVQTLVPLHWTEAERGDLNRYDGTEVIQFHRKSGTFQAGERIAIADFKPGMRLGPASTFSVFGRNTIKLAAGDRIRITAPGKSADMKHKLDNGSQYEVAGIDEKGIHLTNDWTLAPDFAHLNHGYVTTSHASQGKTVDRVLIAMGKESLPAISAEQFYVSVSRGKEKATIFTDVPTPELREAIQKADSRKSATELFNPQRRNRVYAILKRAREAFQNLRTRHVTATHEREKQRERFNGR